MAAVLSAFTAWVLQIWSWIMTLPRIMLFMVFWPLAFLVLSILTRSIRADSTRLS